MTTKPEIQKVLPDDNFKPYVSILNESFITVAKEFGLIKKNCPANSAFISENELRNQLTDYREFYFMDYNHYIIGFVGIEKSKTDEFVFYIEKLAVLPEYRHNNFGKQLMDFAIARIKDLKGKRISIGLIDENFRLKKWYVQQGFHETRKETFDHLPFTVCFMEKELR